eukprot:TRINITY_DN3897_c0_g1_i1.p2 TRINITY_DN3897_c0_g1~~TRINITY_DN3897_c0_g1_i1.p2  ORF type:complete len:313 (-),score=44.74 TRINITY_DN3897_c0_g1_i1:212-1150(-)
MGQIISALGNGSQTNVILDLENATPVSEEERQIFDEVSSVLDASAKILVAVQSYKGCEEHIRKAILEPKPENEEAAWQAVLPAVDQLKYYYDFSLELEKVFPKLISALCRNDPRAQLSGQQSLAKKLADVFDFVLQFDGAKTTNPSIQNDFSYYRRSLNRMKLSKQDANITIRDDVANKMSLFFAYPTPMMNTVIESTKKLFSTDSSISRDNVTTALAAMGNVCQNMIEKKIQFRHVNTVIFCLRAMTGSIILYDHISPSGAFGKKSGVNIKGCINTLKTSADTSSLLNALKYTTLHLNDPDTPASIKAMLD